MHRIANEQQYDAWNGDGGRRWVADPDHRDRIIAPVGDALLGAARLVSGEEVLDVGCGCGATALAAARIVAPGSVTGLDISDTMLAVARERAREQVVANVHFEQGDAQTELLPAHAFDVAISRFGTMFFDDAVAAFANIGRALRPGGRLAIATWQPLIENDWLTIPNRVLAGYGKQLEGAGPGGPGMFGQSDPAALTATLRDADFDDVRVEPRRVTLTIGTDASDAAAHVAGSGAGYAALEAVPEADRPAALDAVRAELEHHATPAGVQLGGAIRLTTAVARERP